MSTFETLSFYRGVSAQCPLDKPMILAPRRDRAPRNSTQHFHSIADKWFSKTFGLPYRSAGLFVTSSLSAASTYAASPTHVLRIVPLGEYRYCWSPRVSDLLFVAQEFASAPASSIEERLGSLMYSEGALSRAHQSGNEVMLWCERYIGIPIALLGIKESSVSRSIILP